MDNRPDEDDLKVLEAMNKGNERNPYWSWDKLSDAAKQFIYKCGNFGVPLCPSIDETADAIRIEHIRSSDAYTGEHVEAADDTVVTWLRGYLAANEELLPIINNLSTPDEILYYVGPNQELHRSIGLDPRWFKTLDKDRSHYQVSKEEYEAVRAKNP
jgi:hypothetical protein